MARPSLPTLTWTRSSVTNITTATMNEVLEAIKTLVDSATHWEVKSSDTDTGSASVAFIQIGAKSDSTLTKQRICIATNGTSTIASGSMALCNSTNTNRRSQPANESLCVAYAPEGGDAGTFTVDSAKPWNTPDQRSIGYGVWGSIQSSGSKTINVWLLESDEILAVCLENATDSKIHAFIAGPTLIGASTDSADVDTDDRIYGVASSDTDGINTGYWTNTNEWLSTQTNNGNANANWHYAFDPQDTDKYMQLERVAMGNGTTGTNSWADGGIVSGSGAYVGYDIQFWTQNGAGYTINPAKFVGTFRQMRVIRDNTSRVEISSGGSTAAIVLGSSPSNPDVDALGFTNS